MEISEEQKEGTETCGKCGRKPCNFDDCCSDVFKFCNKIMSECHGEDDPTCKSRTSIQKSPESVGWKILSGNENEKLSNLCLKIEREGWLAPAIFEMMTGFFGPLIASREQQSAENAARACLEDVRDTLCNMSCGCLRRIEERLTPKPKNV